MLGEGRGAWVEAAVPSCDSCHVCVGCLASDASSGHPDLIGVARILRLKRGIKGTYVSVEPFHLFRYLDEQVFRFNNRKMSDGLRFLRAAAGIIGKRLTYAELIGAEATT